MMKHTARSVIVFQVTALLFQAGLAFPQDLTPLALTDAIARALKNNRQLQAAQLQTDAAKSVAEQARGALMPRVDIIEGFNYSDKPTLVFSNRLDQGTFKQENFAIGSLNNPTPITNLNSQIRVEQPLYAGGRLLANLRQAGAAAEASRELTQRTEQEVVTATIEAYYQVLLAQNNTNVVNRALDSARAHLQRSNDLFEKGLAVRADYLRTQVLLGTLEREKLETDAAVTIQVSRLRQLLGVEAGRLQLTDTVSEDGAPIEELTALKARARGQRPDLKAALKEIERSQESVTAARADYYPSVAFVSQYEGNTQKFSRSGENFAVFVNARWNLFNGFATQQKVVQEQALHKRAQLQHQDLLQSAELDVERAYLGLTTSRRQVAVARENVAQAAEALRMTSDRYAVGLARNVDVLDGETALKRAEQDLLTAQVNSQMFRARLRLAAGERP